MFKKRRRHFRQRQDNDSDGGNHEEDQDNIPPQMTAKPVEKIKKKKLKEKTLNPITDLHLEGEEEIEEFKVKKSSASRKLKKESKKLKKERERDDPNEDGDEQVDEKPLMQGVSAILNGDSAADMDLDSDLENNGEENDDKAAAVTHHPFKSVLERGEIPDANLIHLARKKRALLREGADFIALDESQKVATPPSSTQRLVREDDNDLDSGDERLDFTMNRKERERKEIENQFINAEQGSDDEHHSDHEVNEWEAQQIRKVVGRKNEDLIPISQRHKTDDYYQFSMADSSHVYDMSAMDAVLKPLPDTINIDQIKKEIRQRIDNMNQVHRVHTQELENVTTGLAQSQKSEAELLNRSEDSQIMKLNSRYTFYQQTRSYIRDLLDCFNAKYETVCDLDVRMNEVLRNRAERLVKRRQDDVKDETSDCSSINKAAQPQLEARLLEAKRRRVADREARRLRRRRTRADKQTQQSHHEGLSSDDEWSHSDIIGFNNQRNKILEESKSIFSDVVDEFSSPVSILDVFRRWRELYNDAYTDAYISLCLPKLLTPLIKISLFNWSPVFSTSQTEEWWCLTDMSWYKPVLLYSRDCEPSNDDHLLLPNVVEKVLCAKITGCIDTVFDPMSTTQCKNLSTILYDFVSDYPTVNADSKNVQTMIVALEERITRCLDDDTFMPLFTNDLLTKSVEARSFLHRQIWTMIKLYKNILLFRGVLSDETLKNLSLDSLLNRYIMLGLQCAGAVGTMDRIYTIIDSLPSRWLKSDDDCCIKELDNLVRFISVCMQHHHTECNTLNDADRNTNRNKMKEYLDILIDINAIKSARTVSDQYSIRLPKSLRR